MTEHDAITKQNDINKKRPLSFKVAIALATVLVFFLAGFFGYYMPFRSVDSIVYLDINPSIQIITNRQDKVLNAYAVNDDAKEILEGIDFRGKDLDELSIELVEVFLEKGYLDESHNTILISIKNDNEEKLNEQKKRLSEKVTEYLQNNNMDPVILAQSITDDDFDDGQTYSISEGRLKFIGKILRANSDLEIQDLVELSLQELMILISENDMDLDDLFGDDEDETEEESSPYSEDETIEEETSPYSEDETEEESSSPYSEDETEEESSSPYSEDEISGATSDYSEDETEEESDEYSEDESDDEDDDDDED